ncbi:hypothetical protein BHM03_00046849 [Ensete ventricosum]|nr:hypothetical protein BHM03_00046849 [Ensete ventricosum]
MGGTYRFARLLVRGLLATVQYHQNRPSAVDFSRWRSIEGENGKKKKKRKRRKKKKRRRRKKKTFPRAVLIGGRFFSRTRRRNVSPRGEEDRGDIANFLIY